MILRLKKLTPSFSVNPMNLEKLFDSLSKILSEKENAKIEIKLVEKRGDDHESISTSERSSEEVRRA